MKKAGITIQRICAVCIPAFLPAAPVHAQATLAGRVLDEETRRPVANTSVLLVETGHRKYTNGEGRFAFENLVAGHYTIAVHHIAYADVERTLAVHDSTINALILLRPAINEADEIVVRGTRALSSPVNISFPVEVAAGDGLARQAPLSVSDALAYVPGLARVRDGIWATTLSIRGMSRSNIVTLVDNARIETAGDIAGGLSLINIQDVERVETMKSSGSVLYGAGALGGVVHVMMKRPSFSDRAETGVELSEAWTGVDNGLSQHLAVESSTERYAIRLSGGYRRAGDTMTPGGILENSRYRDFSLSNALAVRTFGEQSLLLNYQRSQAEDTGIPGGAPIAAAADARYTLARRERIALEYVMPNMLPDLPLLTVRLSRQVITRNVEIIQSPELVLTPHAVNTTISAGLESRILPDVNDCLTVGVEVWQRELDSRREKIDQSRNQITGERPAPVSRNLSAGVFAQNEWHSSSGNVVMMLGARYDRARVVNDATMNPAYVISGGTLNPAPSGQKLLWHHATVHDQSWSMNAGVRYRVTPACDASFFVATAFRSPSLEERFQYIDLGNLVRIGDPSLQPERSLSFNAGLHIGAEGLTIRTDLFLHQLSNLITEIPGAYDGRPALVKSNIGTARLYGFEISGELALSTRLVLKSSAAYVRGRDTRNHADLPHIPPLSGRVEISTLYGSLGTLHASLAYAATQNAAGPGGERTPGYAVVDVEAAGVPLHIGFLSLGLRSGIQNIFNRSYRNHLSTLRGLVRSEPGRNVYVSLRIGV